MQVNLHDPSDLYLFGKLSDLSLPFLTFILAKYKKPLRRCVFCKQDVSKLKGHIMTFHKDHRDVIGASKEDFF